MRAHLFLISLALSSAACSDRADQAEKAGVEDSAAPQARVSAKPAARAHAVEQETEFYQFAYAWPAAASAEPGLAAYLGKKAEAMLAELRGEAGAEWETAQGQDRSPRQHSASEEWKVVADLPRFLSLSGHLTTYSGGAHGSYGTESLVWDREKRQALRGIDLFNSPVSLEQGLGQRLCDRLNAAREKRRGTKIEEGSAEMFDKCPGLDEADVLLGSSNGKTFDRVTVYFGPYVAGSYAEGDYELDFNVTASILDAVKPEFADAFSVRG